MASIDPISSVDVESGVAVETSTAGDEPSHAAAGATRAAVGAGDASAAGNEPARAAAGAARAAVAAGDASAAGDEPSHAAADAALAVHAAARVDEIAEHPDDAVTAYTYFEPREPVLRELVQQLFGVHWSSVVVGPCIEGAVFEVCFQQAPEIRYSDGYLTVDLGPWHFHLCLGPHKGSASEELRRMRPVAKVGFFDRRGKGCGGGRSWGLRFWNGYGEQMTTVFLPNPRISDDQELLPKPDWSRLDLYYRLREQFLGEPMPTDLEAAALAPFAVPTSRDSGRA